MMDGNIILSVAKAMGVLQILSQAESPLSLKELATRCGYPKSTVFGLLTTMRAYDVAAQTPDGKYTLGLRLFEYGRQVERSWDISLVARPYMEHLYQRTGASVMLSVCEGGSVITLDQVETRDNLRICVGYRFPAANLTVRRRARSFWHICPHQCRGAAARAAYDPVHPAHHHRSDRADAGDRSVPYQRLRH